MSRVKLLLLIGLCTFSVTASGGRIFASGDAAVAPGSSQNPASSAQKPAQPAYQKAVDSVSELDARAWIGFLASRELGGRESGYSGYDVACEYVASEFARAGAKPAIGDSYFQPFSLLESLSLSKDARLSFSGKDGKETRVALTDDDVFVTGGSQSVTWEGRWVCAGRGYGADSDSRDDFAGLDLEDAIVLIAPPEGSEPEYRAAREAGARRVVVVSDKKASKSTTKRWNRRRRLTHLIDDDAKAERSRAGLEVIYVSRRTVDPLLAVHGTSVANIRAGHPASFELKKSKVALRALLDRREIKTRNVVAKIEGSDPKLRDEFVVVGAHLDHVGEHDGKVFFGADDNASGTAAVLGAAKGMALLPVRPKRSVLFVLFGAEEMGLLGSRYFVDRPLVPLEKMAFMVNLDMVGRNEEHGDEKAEDNVNSLHVVGVSTISRELNPWIQRVNKPIGFSFEYDEERVMRRSDHWHFIRNGIPAVFFFAGFHPDYHKPTDVASKVNYGKVVKVARLALSILFEVADRPARLSVNRI